MNAAELLLDMGRLGIRLEADGLASYRAERQPIAASQTEAYSYLFTFLRSLGIRTIELDSRLESNQISDLLVLLYALRQPLGRRSERPPAQSWPDDG